LYFLIFWGHSPRPHDGRGYGAPPQTIPPRRSGASPPNISRGLLGPTKNLCVAPPMLHRSHQWRIQVWAWADERPPRLHWPKQWTGCSCSKQSASDGGDLSLKSQTSVTLFCIKMDKKLVHSRSEASWSLPGALPLDPAGGSVPRPLFQCIVLRSARSPWSALIHPPLRQIMDPPLGHMYSFTSVTTDTRLSYCLYCFNVTSKPNCHRPLVGEATREHLASKSFHIMNLWNLSCFMPSVSRTTCERFVSDVLHPGWVFSFSVYRLQILVDKYEQLIRRRLNPLSSTERPPYSCGKFQPPREVAATPLAHWRWMVSFLLSHIYHQPPSETHYASRVYGFLTAFGYK